MSDQANGGAAGPQLRVLTQYVKDLSFENPNAPNSLGPVDEQPSINLRVDVGVKRLADTDYEVALKIGAEAVVKDKPLFIVEAEYAGLFRLSPRPISKRCWLSNVRARYSPSHGVSLPM
jgi:preprotein translocase subunit SecB